MAKNNLSINKFADFYTHKKSLEKLHPRTQNL